MSPAAQFNGGDPVTSNVGRTPLLHLSRIGREFPGIEFFAKAEWYSAGGSVKDRAALNVVRRAERAGLLAQGRILLDATSGNTGIAYAMLGAARGFKVRLALPANAGEERKRILKAYGADLVFSDPAEGSDGAIRMARKLLAESPELYFYADQYNNPANWQAHYEGTAPEIWEQTGGRVTHFVACLGTSGTFVGTSRRLRELNPAIHCISVQPDVAFHGLEGMKHMATAIVPGIYDPTIADRDMGVATEEAYDMVRRLAREEGLLVGISSGAAVAACLTLARELADERRSADAGPLVMVTVFPDSADKYLSQRFWDES